MQEPKRGFIIRRPETKYILIKPLTLKYEFDKNSKQIIEAEKNSINLLITALRLFKTGYISINNLYFYSNTINYFSRLESSTSLYGIKNCYSLKNEFYYWEPYNLSENIIHLGIYNIK